MGTLIAGKTLHLDRSASPQFPAAGIKFRFIRCHDWQSSCDGWIWLDGYELDEAGDALERRSLFVRVEGIRLAR